MKRNPFNKFSLLYKVKRKGIFKNHFKRSVLKMDIFSLGNLLEQTKNHSGQTPIYVSCMEKDYILSDKSRHSDLDSTSLFVEDGELVFTIDFESDTTLLLGELRALVKEFDIEAGLFLDIEGVMFDEVAEIIMLPEKIILF